jgi:hypothetical protein
MKHEIIYTEHYALIVSDEETKHGDFFISSQFFQPTLEKYIDPYNQSSITKKIIAHRPLTDAPILEGVPLLPEFGKGDDVEKIADVLKVGSTYRDYEHLVKRGIIIGYNKAKETYKYTEEDLKDALFEALNTPQEECCVNNTKDSIVRSIIQSLKQSKRPKYFECETITMNKGYTDKSDYPYQECEILKTITNSQGQTELSGKYIFE